VQYHGLNATVAVPLADRATSLAAAIEEGLWQHAVVAPQRRTSAPTDATGGASAGAAGAGAAGAGATADFDAGRLAYEVCVIYLEPSYGRIFVGATTLDKHKDIAR